MQGNYIGLLERGIIIGLKLAGFTVLNIEKTLQEHNIQASRVTIGRIWNNWQNDSQSLQTFGEKSGRPPIMSEKEVTNLKNFVIENPTSSRKELEASEEANPLGLSGKTLQNTLNAEGFSQKVQQKVISISPQNQEKRVKWARDILRNKRKRIKQCVYTDETYIEFQNHRRTLIWTQEDQTDYSQQKLKSWPQKLLIWGSISQNGPEHIAFIEGNIDQEKYINILEDFFSSTEIDFTERFFQHDNAKAHTGQKVQKFLVENSINVLDWASQSPDVNPIEKVWSLLKWKVSKNINKLDDIEQLKVFIKNAFMTDTEIRQLIINSINKIPDILLQIIEKKGDVVA